MKISSTLASINMPKKANRLTWVLGIAIVLLLAGGGTAWYLLKGSTTAKVQAAAKSSVTLTKAAVTRGDISIAASGSGTLTSSQSADLSFSTSGTVAEVDVKLGDMVTTGQVLARLGNSQDLEAKTATYQLQFLQAQQTLKDLQGNSSLALAQAYQDMVTAQETYNDAVTTSQRTAYARCSEETNTQLKAKLEAAKSKLDELGSRNYGSDGWINAQSNYETALANYNYCIAYTGDEKTNAEASLQVSKTALDQAKTKYATLKESSGVDPIELALDEAKVKEAETALANAQQDLEGITLKAPFDGKVVYLAASAGAIVDTSKFISVADVSHPTIKVSVDETDISKLLMDSPANVVFDAYQDETFSGKVIQVDALLTTSGNYKVATGLVQLDDSAAKTTQNLPLGVNATVVITNKEVKNALLIPVLALKNQGNQKYSVLVVGSDGKTTQQSVEVGIMDSSKAQITSGLNEGDVVAIENKSSSSSNSNQGPGSGGMMPPMDGGMAPAP